MTPEHVERTIVIGGTQGRRHWLRPRWYGMTSDSFGFFQPWPHTFKVVATGPGLGPYCARCCDDRLDKGGFDDPDGYHCPKCHGDLYGSPKRAPWPRRWRNQLASRLHNAYFWWCENYGREVSQDAELERVRARHELPSERGA